MAFSGVDDRGLMQISPTAAQVTAKNIGINHIPNKLYDPHFNIQIGSKYMSLSIERYNRSYILGIPAYNCGHHNMDKAIAQFGDPRKITNLHQIIDWLEQIPICISRTNIQNVLESMQIYRIILSNNNKLLLRHDLIRGNYK